MKVTLSRRLKQLVDDTSRRLNIPRTEVVRQAIEAFDDAQRTLGQ